MPLRYYSRVLPCWGRCCKIYREGNAVSCIFVSDTKDPETTLDVYDTRINIKPKYYMEEYSSWSSPFFRPHFYQTRSAWSVDQGSNKNHSPAYNFAPTVTKFCVMWEGLSLPHDTKYGNCRCKIVDSRSFPSWSLIHGLRWSGLIKVGPGRQRYWTAPFTGFSVTEMISRVDSIEVV